MDHNHDPGGNLHVRRRTSAVLPASADVGAVPARLGDILDLCPNQPGSGRRLEGPRPRQVRPQEAFACDRKQVLPCVPTESVSQQM